MLIVEPEAFFQSNPPVTESEPFGRLALPPTPQELRIGTLAAAAPASPNAASMFRRDICGPVLRFMCRCPSRQAGIRETLTDSAPLATRSRPFWNSDSGSWCVQILSIGSTPDSIILIAAGQQ